MRLIKPQLFLTEEDYSDWSAMTEPSRIGDGLGFDATWYGDFNHNLVEYHGGAQAQLLRNAGFGDKRALTMSSLAGALQTSARFKVIYNQSHDDAAIAKYRREPLLSRSISHRCRLDQGAGGGELQVCGGDDAAIGRDDECFSWARKSAPRSPIATMISSRTGRISSAKQIAAGQDDPLLSRSDRAQHPSGCDSVRNIVLNAVLPASGVLVFRRL